MCLVCRVWMSEKAVGMKKKIIFYSCPCQKSSQTTISRNLNAAAVCVHVFYILLLFPFFIHSFRLYSLFFNACNSTQILCSVEFSLLLFSFTFHFLCFYYIFTVWSASTTSTPSSSSQFLQQEPFLVCKVLPRKKKTNKQKFKRKKCRHARFIAVFLNIISPKMNMETEIKKKKH